jgi:hypothetical protein
MTLPKKKNGRRLNSFERFTALTEAYDGLLKNFRELRVAALCPANTWLCSGYVRYLIKTLDVDLEAEAREHANGGPAHSNNGPPIFSGG